MPETKAPTGRGAEERARLATASPGVPGEWKAIGPWLAERAWGTVREDYGADGDPWRYFPHDHARSRAYRWSEDGLAGLCDLDQRLCFALALWNGRDPILKERIYGLSGPEGNHGEDAKEYWWYLDATPTASWLRWRYHYPQREFPYARLVEENRRRSRQEPEFELADTGIFDDDRYFRVEADYAKAGPRDVCIVLRVTNAGPEPADLALLPTLWFRNRWSWGDDVPRPVLRALDDSAPGTAAIAAVEERIGRWRLTAGPGPDGRAPELLFCENETNTARVFGTDPATPWPKDGINDHVVGGAATVNRDRAGTKAACWYRLRVEAGATVEVRLRLEHDPAGRADLGPGHAAVMDARRREADAFHASLAADGTGADERDVMRQAFAGLVWSHQFYHYDVARWLAGDRVAPPASRLAGRNADWTHVNNHDVLSMPDAWEFPWYAAWDLAFHCVVLAHVDPAAAKHQLLLLLREWYMHPNGQLPAYEWAFGDVNPPVQAWAALAVFAIDGGTDHEFLARAFHKLVINFTWWVNRKDARGDNIFEGGFLGLDNIGAFDRSTPLPGGCSLEQSDGTAWMAKFCLNMLEIALRLANRDPAYQDLALKFFEHFCAIALAMRELWDEEDGFFYDRIRMPDGSSRPVRARSMVGLLPLFAAVQLDPSLWANLDDFRARARWYIDRHPWLGELLHLDPGSGRPGVVKLVDDARLVRMLGRMLDESEFLSPHGLRSLSRHHREHPLEIELPGGPARLDYEPGESTTGLFGGNSNWRGPVWLPLNYLALESLRNLDRCIGSRIEVEMPTGSGRRLRLGAVADEIERRLVGLFVRGPGGRRPVLGSRPLFAAPAWSDPVLFYEYYHGDTGEGLGASHQTGWSALVAAMVANRRQRGTAASAHGRKD
ncbi:MAG: hypothetical protein U1F08_03815 [Steroidobacteraceae bacterium]